MPPPVQQAQGGTAPGLKGVTAAVCFGGDVANPYTVQKFCADLPMCAGSMAPRTRRRPWCALGAWELAQPADKGPGRNMLRWRHEAHDRAFIAAQGEIDPVERAAPLIRTNGLVCEDGA